MDLEREKKAKVIKESDQAVDNTAQGIEYTAKTVEYTAEAVEPSRNEDEQLLSAWPRPTRRETETTVFHDVFGKPKVTPQTLMAEMSQGMKKLASFKWRIIIPFVILTAAVIGPYALSLYAVSGSTPTTKLKTMVMEQRDQLKKLYQNLSGLGSLVTGEMERLVVLYRNLSDLMSVRKSSDRPIRSCGLLPPDYPPGNYYIINANGVVTMQNCSRPPSCYGGSGAWAKVAELHMSDLTNQCPTGLKERNDNGLRTCVRSTTLPTCSSSVNYNLDRLEFSRVCGRIIGYQIGRTNAFVPQAKSPLYDPNEFYVDGVTLTHGINPGTHIWTFAAAIHDSLDPNELVSKCDCSVGSFSFPANRTPGFVGKDYFCDSGVRTGLPRWATIFANDPLWDGAGCSKTSTCCIFNTPPWFFKQLDQPTSDHIEMRLCSDEPARSEDVAISLVELYVQ